MTSDTSPQPPAASQQEAASTATAPTSTIPAIVELAADAAPTPEERQETLSISYVLAARIVGPLASGRYAIQTLARGRIIPMLAESALPPEIVEACRRSREDYNISLQKEEERRKRLRAGPWPLSGSRSGSPSGPPSGPAVAIDANPEDLGL